MNCSFYFRRGRIERREEGELRWGKREREVGNSRECFKGPASHRWRRNVRRRMDAAG